MRKEILFSHHSVIVFVCGVSNLVLFVYRLVCELHVKELFFNVATDDFSLWRFADGSGFVLSYCALSNGNSDAILIMSYVLSKWE